MKRNSLDLGISNLSKNSIGSRKAPGVYVRGFWKGSGPLAGFLDEENGVADDGQAAEEHGRHRNKRIQQPGHSHGDGYEVVET